MRRALVGSIAMHAAVLGLLVGVRASEGPGSGPGRTHAAIVELVETTPTEVEVVTPAAARDGGGAPAAGAPTSAALASPRPRGAPAAARRASVPAHARDRGGERADDGDPRGAITIEPAGGDLSGTGTGQGGGTGAGTGFGIGTGGTIARIPELPAPPPAPRASKARPPRLIYPARTRDAEDRELFVARVTVDDEGYVVGARLVRGFGGRRDDVAGALIWKFRYAPALDDDGRPIRATVDQGFLVE